MSLFVNILIHPVVAQAQVDVQLLESAVSIISDLSLSTFYGEKAPVQAIDTFVGELARLGGRAIQRAKAFPQSLPWSAMQKSLLTEPQMHAPFEVGS